MNCRICGWTATFEPWGPDGKTPSYQICACCGAEFGTEDRWEEQIKRRRREWLLHPDSWFRPEMRPTHWNWQEQLRGIDPTYIWPDEDYLQPYLED